MFDNINNNHLIIDKLENLLAKNKSTYKTDLHIHTSYSADGLQTVRQGIDKAKENGFDIISISDHDSIGAYQEIVSNSLFDDQEMPVIIPGIEFTVSYPEYYGRCHVLKYFFDFNNKPFLNNLQQNHKAYWDRVSTWFRRIEENAYLQDFINKNNVSCTERGYRDYLTQCVPPIPEYHTLMQYIYSLLNKKGIYVWDVYEKAIAANNADDCEVRKDKKKNALNRFYHKYNNQDISHNYRKLRPILAPVGVDDAEFPDFASSGSLSVNEFGQVPIRQLVNSGFNVLAHPDTNRLACIDELNEEIQGLELNCHSSLEANVMVYDKAKSLSLLITKGSDKHSNTDEYYEDLHFYEISHEDLTKLVSLAKDTVKRENL